MLLLLGCAPEPVVPDRDTDAWAPPAGTILVGGELDEGFGARLAWGADLWVGAPFSSGGRAYLLESPQVEGASGAFCGAGLAALGDGRVLVGCPGIGVVRVKDTVVLESPGIGGVVAARDDTWVASTATGIVDAAGARTEWDRRPDALALLADGTVVAGFARGDTAVLRGGVAMPRPAGGDEAGYALLAADLGAGEQVVIGAPGIGMIYLDDLREPIGTGAGRFGAALAVDAAGTLYVGAPMADGAAGAVYAVRDGTITLLASGSAGDQFGSSLAIRGDTLAVGAPGAADAAGSVFVLGLP